MATFQQQNRKKWVSKVKAGYGAEIDRMSTTGVNEGSMLSSISPLCCTSTHLQKLDMLSVTPKLVWRHAHGCRCKTR